MKKKTIIRILLAVNLCIVVPASTFAWGANGHRFVVETALAILTPQAKQNVLNYFSGYSTDLAAVWMDSVRINHVPQYKYMSDWHFLNMEAGQTYARVAGTSDVVYNLQRMVDFFSNIPSGTSPDTIRMNLKILFHLMGDITQPLHVGYGSDGGGNDFDVTTPVFNQSGNTLHHVWDDIIIEDGHITPQTCLTYYHTLSPAQITGIIQGNTQDWMLQARSYLPQAYACNPVRNQNTQVSKAYLDGNVAIVQQQLVYAAIRLANVLQKAFGS